MQGTVNKAPAADTAGGIGLGCRFWGSGATVEKAIHGVSAAQGNKKGKPEEVNAIPLYAPQHLTCSDGVSGILKIEHKIQNAECSLETLNTSFVR